MTQAILDPELFGEEPKREPCFAVRETWAQLLNLPDDHPLKEVEFLHRQLNEECCVMENAARSLVQFTDADWNVRKGLARQCADEARHVLNYRRMLHKRGGRLGQFPIMNFQYRILGKINSLIGRLAVQNRSFEAEGIDAVTHAWMQAELGSDSEMTELYDAQLADEIGHVRYANAYIRAELARSRKLGVEIVRALDQASRAFQIVFADGGADVDKYDVAVGARLEAGFSDDEVETAVRLSEQRRHGVRARMATMQGKS